MGFDSIEIIRSRRRTIAIQIKEDASVVVRAPVGMAEAEVRDFVIKHSVWIEKKQNEIKKKLAEYVPKRFTNGESFLYLGRYYRIRMNGNQKEPLVFNNGFYIRDGISGTRLKELFIKLYRQVARRVISERVRIYSDKFRYKYNKLKITGAEKRWGSCSSKGSLNFSWRLVMAPLDVIDYVVVHELVHLVEKNHSRRFWATVEFMMPEYKERRKWLKNNGHLLRL